jgi:hypothetical protein
VADMYEVASRIWHTVDQRYYDAGEKVDLGHLKPKQIKRLIAKGAIEAPPEPKAPAKPKAKAAADG